MAPRMRCALPSPRRQPGPFGSLRTESRLFNELARPLGGAPPYGQTGPSVSDAGERAASSSPVIGPSIPSLHSAVRECVERVRAVPGRRRRNPAGQGWRMLCCAVPPLEQADQHRPGWCPANSSWSYWLVRPGTKPRMPAGRACADGECCYLSTSHCVLPFSAAWARGPAACACRSDPAR